MRTESDLRAALLTLAPEQADNAVILASARQRIKRRKTTRRAGIAGAVAVCAAAATVLITLSSGQLQRSPDQRPSAAVAVAKELRTLAVVAAARPAFQRPGPGQFWYSAQKGLAQYCLKPINAKNGYGYFQNCYIRVEYVQLIRQWTAANGSGRVLVTTSRTIFPSVLDRARWITAGRPRSPNERRDLTFGPGKLVLGPSGLGKLPTDPAKLAAVIKAGKFEGLGGSPGPGEDYQQVTDLLAFQNTPPALRAAAFKVGALLPGVKSLGTVTVHGATGVGIAFTYTYPHLRQYRGESFEDELVFDPATSLLRAEVSRDFTLGKLTAENWSAYLASGLVNSITSRPRP